MGVVDLVAILVAVDGVLMLALIIVIVVLIKLIRRYRSWEEIDQAAVLETARAAGKIESWKAVQSALTAVKSAPATPPAASSVNNNVPASRMGG